MGGRRALCSQGQAGRRDLAGLSVPAACPPPPRSVAPVVLAAASHSRVAGTCSSEESPRGAPRVALPSASGFWKVLPAREPGKRSTGRSSLVRVLGPKGSLSLPFHGQFTLRFPMTDIWRPLPAKAGTRPRSRPLGPAPSRPPLPRASPRAWPAFTRRSHRAGRCPRPPAPCPRHADRRRRTELGPFSQSGDSSAALGPALPARALFLVTKSEMLKTPLGTFRLGCDPARG